MTSSAACGRTYQAITTFPRLKHSLSWCCYLNANAKRFSCLVFFSTCFYRQWANICVYFHLCLSKFTALVISPTESCTRGQLITLTENSPDQNEKEEGINEGWYEMNYTSPPCNFYELKTRRINSNIFSLSLSLCTCSCHVWMLVCLMNCAWLSLMPVCVSVFDCRWESGWSSGDVWSRLKETKRFFVLQLFDGVSVNAFRLRPCHDEIIILTQTCPPLSPRVIRMAPCIQCHMSLSTLSR